MAKSFKPLCSLFVLAVLAIWSNRVLFVSEARPLKRGDSWSLSSIKSSSLFDIDEFYIKAVKTSGGPSSGGKGHSFTASQSPEGIKNGGPSSGGKGHAFTTSFSLGGIKTGGPSSEGKGHAFTTSETLGGIKTGGPSSEGEAYAFINSHTALGLGGIKTSGPSAGGRGN